MTDDLMQNTALHLAAGSGNNIATKLLLDAGADVEAKNQKVYARTSTYNVLHVHVHNFCVH